MSAGGISRKSTQPKSPLPPPPATTTAKPAASASAALPAAPPIPPKKTQAASGSSKMVQTQANKFSDPGATASTAPAQNKPVERGNRKANPKVASSALKKGSAGAAQSKKPLPATPGKTGAAPSGGPDAPVKKEPGWDKQFGKSYEKKTEGKHHSSTTTAMLGGRTEGSVKKTDTGATAKTSNFIGAEVDRQDTLKGKHGTLTNKAHAQAGASLDASASYTKDNHGVAAEAKGKTQIGLAGKNKTEVASNSFRAGKNEYRFVGEGKLKGMAGAEAKANVYGDARPGAGDLGAGGSAGATAGATGSASGMAGVDKRSNKTGEWVPVFRIGGGAEGTAGAGASAHAKFGMKDGLIDAGFGASTTLGLGGGADMAVKIHPARTAAFLRDGGTSALHGAQQQASHLQNLVNGK